MNPSRPITIEKPFTDCPIVFRDRDGIWFGGTVDGYVEISHEPGGPTWVSDLWVSVHSRDGSKAKLIRLDPNNRDLFGMIAESVERAGLIDHWVDRELAYADAA